MLVVADLNVGAPHGHLQLVSEAHMLVRTWLHRLTWLQVRVSSDLTPTVLCKYLERMGTGEMWAGL
jgi:hypothetical protein